MDIQKVKTITKKDTVKSAVRTVDFYIDAHLKLLHQAMQKDLTHCKKYHKKRLTELVVKRHYLDPERTIPNNF